MSSLYSFVAQAHRRGGAVLGGFAGEVLFDLILRQRLEERQRLLGVELKDVEVGVGQSPVAGSELLQTIVERLSLRGVFRVAADRPQRRFDGWTQGGIAIQPDAQRGFVGVLGDQFREERADAVVVRAERSEQEHEFAAHLVVGAVQRGEQRFERRRAERGEGLDDLVRDAVGAEMTDLLEIEGDGHGRVEVAEEVEELLSEVEQRVVMHLGGEAHQIAQRQLRPCGQARNRAGRPDAPGFVSRNSSYGANSSGIGLAVSARLESSTIPLRPLDAPRAASGGGFVTLEPCPVLPPPAASAA